MGKTPLERQQGNDTGAILMQPVVPVFDRPVLMNEAPETTDILLHGQRVRITEICHDESFDDSVPYSAVRFGRLFHFVTDYGYEGFLPDAGERIEPLDYLDAFYTRADIGVADAERMRGVWAQYADVAVAYEAAYEEVDEKGYGNIYNKHAALATVWAPCADLFSVPDITNTTDGRITLFRGAKLLIAADQSDTPAGWTKVFPANAMFYGEEDQYSSEDGEEAEHMDAGAHYIRSSALVPRVKLVDIVYDPATRLPGTSVYGRVTPADEETFRKSVVDTAMLYLNTQYRWAGKTPNGIDCSGLCSMAYMLNGVYIYRDAELAEGFPIHRIVTAEAWENDRKAAIAKLRPADLIFYKGHVTMYIGNGKYIHATGKAGSDGVVINSFDETDPLYRKDLAEEIVACGSLFA